MDKQLKTALTAYYGMSPEHIQPIRGGWSALAFRFAWAQQTYFLKVYEKKLASTAKLTEQISSYLPVVHWLTENTALQGKIPQVIAEKDGRLFYADRNFIYLLCAFSHGQTVGDLPLNQVQVRELAQIVAELHNVKQPWPLAELTEQFTITFAAELEKLLAQELPQTEVGQAVQTEKQLIYLNLARLTTLAELMRAENHDFVLCHTDIHGWNLIQGSQLVLIDWEGLKLAPAEADLFIFTQHVWWQEFLAVYLRKRPGCQLNYNALAFYSLHRCLQDIWELLQRLVYDKIDAEQQKLLLHYLGQEYQKLKQIN